MHITSHIQSLSTTQKYNMKVTKTSDYGKDHVRQKRLFPCTHAQAKCRLGQSFYKSISVQHHFVYSLNRRTEMMNLAKKVDKCSNYPATRGKTDLDFLFRKCENKLPASLTFNSKVQRKEEYSFSDVTK